MFFIMDRYVTRSYLIEMIDQAYLNRDRNCHFCMKLDFNFCQTTSYMWKK